MRPDIVMRFVPVAKALVEGDSAASLGDEFEEL